MFVNIVIREAGLEVSGKVHPHVQDADNPYFSLR